MVHMRAELLKHRAALKVAFLLLIVGAVAVYAIPAGFLLADARAGAVGTGSVAIGLPNSAMYGLTLLGTTSPFVGLLLGVALGAKEFRPNTIETSIVASGGWRRLIAAKFALIAVAVAAVTATVLLVCAICATIVTVAVARSIPDSVSLVEPVRADPAELSVGLLSVLAGLCMWAAMGFFIGSVAKSMFVGSVIGVAWLIVEAFWVSPYIPGTAQAALLDALTFVAGRYSSVYAPPHLGLSWAFGAYASLGWTVAFLAGAWLVWRARFRDRRRVLATPARAAVDARRRIAP